MNLDEVIDLINGKLIVGPINFSVKAAFSSDLMSDVLAYVEQDTALLTGLINNQVIRTAEMLDLRTIIFVRGKQPSKQVIKMAETRDMTLITTNFTLFETSGILYKNGLGALRINNE